jgi:hypothetical protein
MTRGVAAALLDADESPAELKSTGFPRGLLKHLQERALYSLALGNLVRDTVIRELLLDARRKADGDRHGRDL